MNHLSISFEFPIIFTENDFKRWFRSCHIPPDTIFLDDIKDNDTRYCFITILSETYLQYITNNYIRRFFDPEEEILNSVSCVTYNDNILYQGV